MPITMQLVQEQTPPNSSLCLHDTMSLFKLLQVEKLLDVFILHILLQKHILYMCPEVVVFGASC